MVVLTGSARETFKVRVEVSKSDAGVPASRPVSAVISVARCVKGRCSDFRDFWAAPKSTEFTVAEDGLSATLVSTAFGRPFKVAWTGYGEEQSVDSDISLYSPVLPSGQVRARANQRHPAFATVTLLGRACGDPHAELTSTIMFDGRDTDVDLPAMPDSVPPQLRGLEKARCQG